MSDVTQSAIKDFVAADKAYALEVIRDAAKAKSNSQIEFLPDITGRPKGILEHKAYMRDQIRGLEALIRAPFFSRIMATETTKGESRSLQILLTEARDVGATVQGKDWLLVSWTSPLASLLRSKVPGETADFTRRWKTSFGVQATSKYSELLPRFVNAEFQFPEGNAAVASEDELDEIADAEPIPAALVAVEYEAKPTFGLSDIIVLVDEPQRAAMSLPFSSSVIIEGPPGSGKTSVGLMRIACLLARALLDHGVNWRTRSRQRYGFGETPFLLRPVLP